MDEKLDLMIKTLDNEMYDVKQFNGYDVLGFLKGKMHTNEFIKENMSNVSKMLDSGSIKSKLIIEKLYDLNATLKEKMNQFVYDGEITELNNCLNDGVINLIDKKMVKDYISKRQLDIMKDVHQLIKMNSELQESMTKILIKFDENYNLIEISINEIEDIKLRYREALEIEKKKEMLRQRQNEENMKENLPEEPIINEIQSEELIENENQSGESIEIENPIKTSTEVEILISIPSRIENEILNPENWNRFRYPLRGDYFPEIELIYMINAFKDTLEQAEDVSVKLDKLENILSGLGYQHDILSNIIRVEPAGLELLFDSRVPWRISIPYSIIRNPNREVVILCKDEIQQRYLELDTQDILYDESKEEGIKFAEASLPSPNCLCVVVSKLKVEKFEINKKAATIESKVDDRITITIPPSSIMISVPMQLTVQPIESGLINDLKIKLKTPVLNGIQTISPIIEINSDLERKLLKPIILQLPIPYPTGYVPNRSRIFSAAPSPAEKNDRRPKTSLTRQISNEANSIIKLVKYNEVDKVWKVQREHKLVLNKNGDSMSIELKLQNVRLVAIRCTDEMSDEKIHKAMEVIEESSESRLVQFICAQKNDNPNRLILLITPPNKVEKLQKFLLEQNYNEDTISVSSELNVRERDKFQVNFRGNIEPLIRSELIVTYNSQLSNRLEFNVHEKDKYAQKNKDSYQGYVSVVKAGGISLDNLWEILVSIPKFENEKNNSLEKDFDFRPTDIINKEYLKYLSHEIGEDWKDLGYALRVPEETIRRISNDTREDMRNMAYQCLLKWIKNLTVYSNKVVIMEKALKKIGRSDLLKDLIYRSTNK